MPNRLVQEMSEENFVVSGNSIGNSAYGIVSSEPLMNQSQDVTRDTMLFWQ